MNFIEALKALNDGETVLRLKWGGKAKVYKVHNKLNNITHIEVRSSSNCLIYSASSEDLLALDWDFVNKEIPLKQVEQEDIKL
jgi:hypothetical protein